MSSGSAAHGQSRAPGWGIDWSWHRVRIKFAALSLVFPIVILLIVALAGFVSYSIIGPDRGFLYFAVQTILTAFITGAVLMFLAQLYGVSFDDSRYNYSFSLASKTDRKWLLAFFIPMLLVWIICFLLQSEEHQWIWYSLMMSMLMATQICALFSACVLISVLADPDRRLIQVPVSENLQPAAKPGDTAMIAAVMALIWIPLFLFFMIAVFKSS